MKGLPKRRKGQTMQKERIMIEKNEFYQTLGYQVPGWQSR
jgi:hypothetical protein